MKWYCLLFGILLTLGGIYAVIQHDKHTVAMLIIGIALIVMTLVNDRIRIIKKRKIEESETR